MPRFVIRAGGIPGLLDMLRYARETTIQAVEGLTVAELDHRFDAESNSIGALLRHIASVEAYYQVHTFEEREFTAAESDRWLGGLEMRHEVTGRTLQSYMDTLATVRERTEDELASRDDDWLFRVEPWAGDDANNHWKWFHVCEDEISHRGQIRWLRKRLPRRSAT
jgi:uncharacterized damage-inducible protein DinB